MQLIKGVLGHRKDFVRKQTEIHFSIFIENRNLDLKLVFQFDNASVYENVHFIFVRLSIITKKWKLVIGNFQFNFLDNEKNWKFIFWQFSIQFSIFQIMEKKENWFFGNFRSIFNSLHNGKSNSMPFNRTLHFRMWVVDPKMTSEF